MVIYVGSQTYKLGLCLLIREGLCFVNALNVVSAISFGTASYAETVIECFTLLKGLHKGRAVIEHAHTFACIYIFLIEMWVLSTPHRIHSQVPINLVSVCREGYLDDFLVKFKIKVFISSHECRVPVYTRLVLVRRTFRDKNNTIYMFYGLVYQSVISQVTS